MKKTILTIFGAIAFLTVSAQSPRENFEKKITPENLREYLSVIASDEMEGRDTGSKGQKKAAEYIISNLKQWGLTPIVNTTQGKSYLQEFSLYKAGIPEGSLTVNNKTYTIYQDYMPGSGGAQGVLNPETVFVGYGRQNKDVDDYNGKDVKGKAVVYLAGSPDKEDKTWAGFQGTRLKAQAASSNGAVAIFEISLAEGEEFAKLANDRKAMMGRFSRLTFDKGAGGGQQGGLPSFTVSKELGMALINVKAKKFNKYLADSNAGLKTKPVKVKINAVSKYDEVKTANIIGFLEGTDKKDEVVVITAHYDHLGMTADGQIYNGADDDGSGTVGVMEIAKTFAQAKKEGHGPRRSIMFMWVTGEEKGLLGSSYYVDRDPIIPLNRIICDLNIDMIGRVDKEHEANPDFVYLVGSDKLSSELHEISERMNRTTVNLELDYKLNDPKDPERIYYRSDHYNFAKPPHKIPVIFYFTGLHEDYHKVGDTVDKILFPRMAKVTKLIFNTAWELANIEKRIVVDSDKP